MRKFVRGLALIAGLAAFSAVRAEDEDVKKAQKDILDVAADVEAGKDVASKVAAIKKKYEDLNTLMAIYKPRERGGLGIGEKSKGDGLELKFIDLGKRAPAKGTLDKQKADLVKAGYVNIAMAKISHAYAPAKPKGGKGPKDWAKYADDQEAASKSLIEAVKKGDGAAVKKAATNINAACTACHGDFRDPS